MVADPVIATTKLRKGIPIAKKPPKGGFFMGGSWRQTCALALPKRCDNQRQTTPSAIS